MGDPLVYRIETGQPCRLLVGVDEDKNVVNSNANDDKQRDQVEKTDCINGCVCMYIHVYVIVRVGGGVVVGLLVLQSNAHPTLNFVMSYW